MVLVPPCTTVGAMVVWVQAWAWRARPIIGSASHISQKPSAVTNGVAISSGKSRPATNRFHVSWMRVSGRYSAIRRTTSAALISALSVRRGCEAWPGVPRTRSLHQ